MTESNGHSTDATQAKELGREQRELVCVLDDTELRARGDEMASAELEQDSLKETRRGLNGQIADLRTKCAKLAEAIDSRSEKRMVACVWIEELAQNAKRLVRQDTGETIDTRALTVSELQGELPGVEGEPANDNGAALPEVDDETGEVVSFGFVDSGPGDSDEGDSDEDEDDEDKVAAAAAPSAARKVRKASKTSKVKVVSRGKGVKPAKASKHTRHIHA